MDLRDSAVAATRRVASELLPDAPFVCLFGSLARGGALPFSDVDVGIWVEDLPDMMLLGDFAGRVEADVGRPVDVLLLRGLPERDPELAYRVACEAVVVAETRPGSFSYFKKTAFLYYLDTQFLRDLTRKALYRRILSGNMGRRNYV